MKKENKQLKVNKQINFWGKFMLYLLILNLILWTITILVALGVLTFISEESVTLIDNASLLAGLGFIISFIISYFYLIKSAYINQQTLPFYSGIVLFFIPFVNFAWILAYCLIYSKLLKNGK